ncbi:MAG TPA: hypothetical protein PK020_04250 [Ilumatobacteraceae bacterium]|nr:hypothetical protein [Ilumatobacteraceae bacterium]
MTVMGRRQFCAALGAGLAGFSAVFVAGCSSSDGAAAPIAAGADAALAGVSFEVRRDPG